MESRNVLVVHQSESAVGIRNPDQNAIASYVGVGVLIYVLLLYMLAPRSSRRPKRRRASL
ncbi:MAG: hypothetical protein AAF959_16650 [Cyanobacteria bacterium P01_D01_bin.56]